VKLTVEADHSGQRRPGAEAARRDVHPHGGSPMTLRALMSTSPRRRLDFWAWHGSNLNCGKAAAMRFQIGEPRTFKPVM